MFSHDAQAQEKLSKSQQDIDKASADSFPASDAPALGYPGANLSHDAGIMPAEAKMIEALNKILEQEHACAIRYATHAAVITGPYAEAVAARLKEIAQDEIDHAEKLRARILSLGGVPSMAVCAADLKYADTLEEIIEINLAEERDAIIAYEAVFAMTPPENVLLYQTLQELIRDEQEHVEELENLLPQQK